ncbi:MAG: single-stranded DNA-binding protein [Candidatus Azobacteroides sp.]|nr:single-stranded DNA-binding protein [Candidatus Azobacteroides sp.]
MSVNKVILLGNVGKDPDVRHLDNNVSVASFSMATTERGYTTQNGTQIPDKTEWHNIVAWRRLAKIAEDYIKKGTQIYVEGKIRTRSWEDQNGVKRYTTEIYADNIELLGRRGDSQQSSGMPPHPATSFGSNDSYEQAKPSAGPAADPFSTTESSDADDLPF